MQAGLGHAQGRLRRFSAPPHVLFDNTALFARRARRHAVPVPPGRASPIPDPMTTTPIRIFNFNVPGAYAGIGTRRYDAPAMRQ